MFEAGDACALHPPTPGSYAAGTGVRCEGTRASRDQRIPDPLEGLQPAGPGQEQKIVTRSSDEVTDRQSCDLSVAGPDQVQDPGFPLPSRWRSSPNQPPTLTESHHEIREVIAVEAARRRRRSGMRELDHFRSLQERAMASMFEQEQGLLGSLDTDEEIDHTVAPVHVTGFEKRDSAGQAVHDRRGKPALPVTVATQEMIAARGCEEQIEVTVERDVGDHEEGGTDGEFDAVLGLREGEPLLVVCTGLPCDPKTEGEDGRRSTETCLHDGRGTHGEQVDQIRHPVFVDVPGAQREASCTLAEGECAALGALRRVGQGPSRCQRKPWGERARQLNRYRPISQPRGGVLRGAGRNVDEEEGEGQENVGGAARSCHRGPPGQSTRPAESSSSPWWSPREGVSPTTARLTPSNSHRLGGTEQVRGDSKFENTASVASNRDPTVVLFKAKSPGVG